MSKKGKMPHLVNPEAIPVEGALGLLALGAVGLRAWRKVRDAAQGTSTTLGVSPAGSGEPTEGKGGPR
jgi:hypothetical protein